MEVEEVNQTDRSVDQVKNSSPASALIDSHPLAPSSSSPEACSESLPELDSPPAGNPVVNQSSSESSKDFDGLSGFELDGVILSVLLVNFHHLLGPVVEFSYPTNILSSPSLDPEIPRILPFLALPDGAHLSDEDYSYFHLVSPAQPDHPPGSEEDEPFPINKTVFGISCNRQLAASELINRPDDVTRSTVQMAVVVLARAPLFGPIRDKLGVVTRAFFAQRDFTSIDILVDFHHSLQSSLRGTVSETTMHMGTSLRELIHKFRHKTLVLLKLMLLQKKIMFFGYPVERLGTFQYTLVSLIPGLLMNLADCGSPALDTRASKAKRASSLRTSDRASMLRFFGFPLDLFGKDAFFQPYLPLQQIDMCKASSWLVGTTNSIMIQQRDASFDCLVNIEHTTFEFTDPKLERLVALTPADRKWMDYINRTVEETWNPEDPTRPAGMVFKGSDDFLRAKFEEYLCSVLASMKHADYLIKSSKPDNLITTGNANSQSNFSLPWIKELRLTPAFQLWDKSTDPVLFDIWDPKHPCEGRVNPVSDIGLRLAEGIHDLNIEQNLAPTREALSSAFSAGSTTFFRAFEGVKTGLSNQLAALPLGSPSVGESTPGSTSISTSGSGSVPKRSSGLSSTTTSSFLSFMRPTESTSSSSMVTGPVVPSSTPSSSTSAFSLSSPLSPSVSASASATSSSSFSSPSTNIPGSFIEHDSNQNMGTSGSDGNPLKVAVAGFGNFWGSAFSSNSNSNPVRSASGSDSGSRSVADVGLETGTTRGKLGLGRFGIMPRRKSAQPDAVEARASAEGPSETSGGGKERELEKVGGDGFEDWAPVDLDAKRKT